MNEYALDSQISVPKRGKIVHSVSEPSSSVDESIRAANQRALFRRLSSPRGLASPARPAIQNDPSVLERVASEFVAPAHMDAIAEASRVGNFAVSFRAAGAATLGALAKGAAAKGHDILEKTIKKGSIGKAYPNNSEEVLEEVRAAGIEGYVGHWADSQLKGIYMSSGHGLGDVVKDKIYPIDMSDLDASLAELKAKENWQALPFTGDYDMHDMISFTTRPHSVPSESPDDHRIRGQLNAAVARVDGYRPFDKKKPHEHEEHHVIRHGAQVNFVGYSMDREREEVKKHGGVLGVVARPGEFPIAFVSKGVWSIVNDIHELEIFYERIGARIKNTWTDDQNGPQFTETKNGMVKFSRNASNP